ncbi:NifB/NifX family molybdenum-iron cluster-binding protein [Thermoanaerobacterium thermosaccharolyticum]|uniref:NifB/NifX family molybdenum-iron cluster-binding protein n=1 Tax=Thermoanaerobacterium thermosaccharolyticum TaxID=1517 RepID=UPI00177D5C79|nr:NifB/NifX family molybdenum-iron cluster-binding protein [Thermoanaerobacterium thermosaccharolyticum]MBE0069333.1 dinitrogenase iron-molybdenum cofactor [Thermoanaerobacterium thermosaccharolyticum]MBE0229391.1 dinitrogenase iron-molybdenum cofactor [Thermoanaerobacterium thermosaccharolyticum]
MKIAVASDGRNVSMHFGHCEGFTIFDVEGNKIISSNFIENPGHRPGYLPEFLKGKGVECIISGGMGSSAIDLFNGYGIDVITGASGDVEEVTKKYVDETLISSGSACEKHEHEDHCED